MIRLFAPPTRGGLVRPNAVTAASLLFHIAAGIMLFVPLARAAKGELIDQIVVYLVPPDQPGSRESGRGVLPVPAALSPGPAPRGVDQGGAAAPERARGALPTVPAPEISPELANQLLPGDNALTEIEVDSAVVRDPASAAPAYPSQLLAKGIQGSVLARYVVDTLGRVDTLTWRVVSATHPDFVQAVRQSLGGMHFRPAIQGGSRVRQLVEQTFRFRINQPDTVRPAPPA